MAIPLTSLSTNRELSTLLDRYTEIRHFSDQIRGPLTPEDCVIQSMPDVSPTRWHLAHTTWFFETFVLAEYITNYRLFDDNYKYLFNSYYNSIGEQFPRPQRGLLSRPGLHDIESYRQHVDERLTELLPQFVESGDSNALSTVELGLQHEQQHQELMLTDIKHVLSCNPLYPAYHKVECSASRDLSPLTWVDYDEDLCWLGHDGQGFSYDNELPRHRQYLNAYALASRPVNCGEYLEFIQDGGYRRAELWLSLGWQHVVGHGWTAPLYWFQQDACDRYFTLAGRRELNPCEPVCHVSYFEADAFARWSGSRLPTELEWEAASRDLPRVGNFADKLLADSAAVHPSPDAVDDIRPARMFGDVWEWTSSSYGPYPGYEAPQGAVGEYNGKFMCNQYVLRGGSCATSQTHIRPTYRNFFPPEARWQFSGIRLAN